MDETLVLKPTEEEIRSKAAYELETQIKQLKNRIGTNFLELGKNLKEVRDNKYCVELGYDSFNQWLHSPEVDISPSWANNFISIYTVYILENKIDPARIVGIDYTKLMSIIPVLRKEPEKINEWIEQASNLRRIDLQKELLKNKIEQRRNDPVAKSLAARENSVHNESAIDTLSKLENDSISLVLLSSMNHESYLLNQQLVEEAHRVLKPGGSLIFMCTTSVLFEIGVLIKNKFNLIRDIIWVRNYENRGNINTLIPAHETLIWASKTENYIYNFDEPESDVWKIDAKREYEYSDKEKPEVLYEKIISMTTDPKDLIVDGNMMTGDSLLVINRMRRKFIGVEKDEDMYRIAVKRLTEASILKNEK